jgi:lipoprotein-anchoring transpeptidase ErfK/SrfK
MTNSPARPALAIPLAILLAGWLGDAPGSARPAAVAHRALERPGLACGDPLAFQVLLDRQSFSPGEIDGRIGPNASRALKAFQRLHGLATTGDADCDTWRALGGDPSAPVTETYRITDADVKGPFEPEIPRDLEQQAKLPAMSYRSALELVGERFHAAPSLLKRMNPRASFSAGDEVLVPEVAPFEFDARPARGAMTPPGVTIEVSREESALRATRADGTLIFFAPVSSGSLHDPLPIGDWTVTSVYWHPAFHYNPELFWDASPSHARATIKPGPRNPVGVVWIGLNLDHYGLHGTPEPAHVGHTQSHGCVRLTNWDAVRVASIVGRGTPVLFR